MTKNLLEDLVPHKQMKFAPVEEDDDELSDFIKTDPLNHDNEWDLHESVNGDKLQAFWTDALNELGPLEAETDPEE